jgi:hypothetical protein
MIKFQKCLKKFNPRQLKFIEINTRPVLNRFCTCCKEPFLKPENFKKIEETVSGD